MKFLRSYNIDIIKLKEGRHSFTFEVSDEFFKFYEAEEWIKGSNITVTVNINKTSSVLEADFVFNGTVRLICDRSLEEFDYPIDLREKVIYKYGAIEQEISEDVFMITKDTSSINVAQLFYEFIMLAIPAKKIHPDYLYEMDEDDFNEEGSLVYISDEKQELNMEEQEEQNSSVLPVDPRWEILNKLKKKD
ncbi:YceD family protein [Shivajiella indica]|uniref:YceD family protein n=1 Tax=Shivajiella indica TaxID=872115 RepID=A0ABW5BCY0_9BACT